jgi:signal recognition particle receptor subunit beta
MASFNRLSRELLFKVVFYGPGLGGKTTTLQHIHSATKPENRGKMVSLATDTDRTLYFDFLPVKLLKLGDMTVKLQLYTVPGQVYYGATRKLVLSGADGIVFVADTQTARNEANLESLDDLTTNLAEQGRKLSDVPHVFQWNKRDLPDVVPLDELDRRLNLFGLPSFPTVATRGDGVFEVLERITRLVVEAYRAELPAPGSRGGKAERGPLFLDAEEVGLADAIKGLADSRPARPGSTGRRALAASPPAILTPASLPTRVPAPHGAPLPAAPAEQASPPLPQPLASADSPGFSFAELWPAPDRDAVARTEQALAARDAPGAVSASEDLLSRVLAAGSVLLGGQAHPRDAAVVVTLLGLDGARYLAFRSVARGVRGKREPTIREALECYAFAIDARRAFDRAAKGP